MVVDGASVHLLISRTLLMMTMKLMLMLMTTMEVVISNKHLVAAVDLEAIEGLEELHKSFQTAVGEVAAPQRQDVDVLRSVGVVLRRLSL